MIIRAFKGKVPKIAASAFIADGVVIIGDVEIGEQASIWYNCVLRADVGMIRVGARSNVQDGSCLHMTSDLSHAVIGEEWGLIGLITVILLLMFIIGRALYLAATAHDTFSRLASGSLALTFCVYVFVNTGMVTGLLPVVGVPLPFISYGGTAMVTLMAGFGILMSLCAKRKLVSR